MAKVRWWDKVRLGFDMYMRMLQYSGEVLMWEVKMRSNISTAQPLELSPDEQKKVLNFAKPLIDICRRIHGQT
jgi:hypothetical protein